MFLATAGLGLWAKHRSCAFSARLLFPVTCGRELCFLLRHHDWKEKYKNWSVISELGFPACLIPCVKASWVCISAHPPQACSQQPAGVRESDKPEASCILLGC